jgi:hypothetical protein
MTICPDLFVHIMSFYVGRIFNYSSVIFSFLSAFIWLRVIRNEQQQQQKGQMFKYLFVSSLIEAIYFTLGSPDPEFFSNIKNMTESSAWKIWHIYFYSYTCFSLITLSNYLELLATFDCYIVIKNKFRFMHTKKFFNIILATLTAVCFILNFNYTLERLKLIQVNNQTTNNDYEFEYYFVDDDLTILIGYYKAVVSFTREALPLILLLIVNILILKTLKEVMKKKREIQNRKNDITASKAELNKLKMIIAICLDYYLLRTPLIIYYVINIDLNNIIWYCLYYYGYASYILSYSLKFFIYYFFNKKFKEYTNSTLRFR